jgi:hypothetical protein
MARPRKNNADYFSHDNDMRNDDKILSVRRKFWHEWYSVWNMLLEKLCKSNLFIIDIDNVSIELLSWDFVVEPEKLKEIIDYFVYIRLIYKEWDRIYSQKMIDRFEWLLSKRHRDIEYRKWKWKEETVIVVENTQSKVKESKVKEYNKEKAPSKIFNKPNIDDIKKYCLERKNKINPQSFIDFYESKWWMVWKNKMKDWKACIRTRESRYENKSNNNKQQYENNESRDNFNFMW